LSTDSPTKKELIVKIDTSEAEKRIRNEFEEQLKTKDETIKSLLSSHKAEVIEGEQKAPIGGDTCTLEANEKARIGEETRISIEGSYVPFDFVRGKTENEVIQKIELLANSECDNKADYQRLMSKLTKKVIQSSKPLDMTFMGSSKEFIKSPKPINEFDSVEVKAQKNAYSDKLRANRTNWRIN
jgi:hypothetical protein